MYKIVFQKKILLIDNSQNNSGMYMKMHYMFHHFHLSLQKEFLTHFKMFSLDKEQYSTKTFVCLINDRRI